MRRAGSDGDGNAEPVVERRLETAAGDPQEGSEARRKLIGCLTAWQCDRVDDAALVFSEMVTNAVLHAGGAVLITARPIDDHHLRLEVYDKHPATPVRCVGGPDGGYGVQIIDRLCESWGTTPTPDGKMIWAVIRSRFGAGPPS